MKDIRCILGRHQRVLGYQRVGALLHYLGVCSRCGDAKPMATDPQYPVVVRIPTRRERREMQRRQRRGEQGAGMLVNASPARSVPKGADQKP